MNLFLRHAYNGNIFYDTYITSNTDVIYNTSIDYPIRQYLQNMINYNTNISYSSN